MEESLALWHRNVKNRGRAFFPSLSFFYSCSFCCIVCHSSLFVKHYVTRKTACCMACRCLKVIVHSCNKLIVSVTVYFTLPHLFTINIWTLNGIKNNCLSFCPHLSRVWWTSSTQDSGIWSTWARTMRNQSLVSIFTKIINIYCNP